MTKFQVPSSKQSDAELQKVKKVNRPFAKKQDLKALAARVARKKEK